MRALKLHLWVIEPSPPGERIRGTLWGVWIQDLRGSKKGDPNHINITIHNNQTNKTKDRLRIGENLTEKTHQRQNMQVPFSIENLLEDFGPDVFHYAYQEAKEKKPSGQPTLFKNYL
jgi:hypothetical protein